MSLFEKNDLRQSEKYGKYMEKTGWVVEKYSDGDHQWQIFVKKIPFLGSVVKFQRPGLPIPFEWVSEVAKKYRACFVKIEADASANSEQRTAPRLLRLRSGQVRSGQAYGFNEVMKTLGEHGFRPDNWPLLPTKTIVLNISPSKEEILERMEKDTRYCVRKSLESGLNVEIINNSQQKIANNVILGSPSTSLRATPESSDLGPDSGHPRQGGVARMTGTIAIELFVKLWNENAKRKGFWVPFDKEIGALWESFGEDAYLIFAYKEPDGLPPMESDRSLLAGGLFLRNGETLHYMHAGATIEGRRLLAPYLVVWEGIKLGKNLGCRFLDLEGVYDERYPKLTRNWKGFTHFKKGFGGKEISYMGSFIKYRRGLIGKFLEFGLR